VTLCINLCIKTNYHPGALGTLFSLVVAAVVGVLLHRRGERFLQQPADDALLYDKRRPILYLRSFSDDFASQPFTRFTALYNQRVEETLVLLNCLGPFIAIGRPSETLPLMGANRYYVNDSEWKTKVMELMSGCRMTIILARTSTQGLGWEIQQALMLLSPERLVFYFPHEAGKLKQERHYQAFKVSAERYFPTKFPDSISSGGFFRFHDNWIPEFIGTTKRNPARAALECTMALLREFEPDFKLTFWKFLKLMPRHRLYFHIGLVLPLPRVIVFTLVYLGPYLVR
jgi:hypothetical protein